MTTITVDDSLSKADRALFTRRAADMTAEQIENNLQMIEAFDDGTTRTGQIRGIYENELVTRSEPKRYTEAELRDVYCVETATEEFERVHCMSVADLYNF